MTDKLVAGGWVFSPEVEAAFRAVPRHRFVPPGASLEDAYGTNTAPIAKSVDGVNLSSVSAPWLQARMITQAGVSPGMRVLEIGSAGYNAALLAEVTGGDGSVATMDIDPEITARAGEALEATGYGDRVTVITGDGGHGFPGRAPFDAIIVTAGAWDVAPAWLAQLADGGTLVLPLRMNTITRALAFRRDGDCWRSTSAELCGFVPMQGIGTRAERTFQLPYPDGKGHVALRFDQSPPEDPSALDGALAHGPVTVWSGVTVGNAVSFEDLHLWLAGFLPRFCRVSASEGTPLAALGMSRGWFPFGGVHGDSLAYQINRKLEGTEPLVHEFGAGAYGPHARDAAEAFAAQVRAWDAAGRDLPADAFTFWPAGTTIPPQPGPVAAFPKNHGTVTVSWASARPWRMPQVT
jgi:protein-L-isoaspartate(D-aspartate) O-methyltransferase